MKICPKCNAEHSKPGMFCSRTCANSRSFTADTNKKRSESNKKAIALLTEEQSKSILAKRITSYRKTKPQKFCICGKVVHPANKHGMCWDCYIQSDVAADARGHHYKNYARLRVIDSNGNDMMLMSSMEIEFYNYLIANDIKWSKPSSLRYKDNIGRVHWYKPDFYLIDTQEIIEIKGHWWNNDKVKMQWVIEQNPAVKIKIIMKNDLKEIVGGKSIGADIGL
jgi:hypothetical protein